MKILKISKKISHLSTDFFCLNFNSFNDYFFLGTTSFSIPLNPQRDFPAARKDFPFDRAKSSGILLFKKTV